MTTQTEMNRYIWPTGAVVELESPPLLASWEKKTHPSQIRLERYREMLRRVVEPVLTGLQSPAALGLVVGWRDDLLQGCDLDNFLTPVMDALGGERFCSVWARKGSQEERSSIYLGPARSAPVGTDDGFVHIVTHGSASKPEWKAEIAAQIAPQESARSRGPLTVELAYGVGPQRNWVTLWKPTLDALEAILGSDDHRPWHPRDDRITVLGLHRTVDPSLGNSIKIDIRWNSPQAATLKRSSVLELVEGSGVSVGKTDGGADESSNNTAPGVGPMLPTERAARLVVPFYLQMMRTNAIEHGAELVPAIVEAGKSASAADVLALLRTTQPLWPERDAADGVKMGAGCPRRRRFCGS